MKQYTLSKDRIVMMKKTHEQHPVIVKQRDSYQICLIRPTMSAMKQVHHRVNVRLICDPHKLLNIVQPCQVSTKQNNDNLVMVRGARKAVALNEPISVGFVMLKISKLIMYTEPGEAQDAILSAGTEAL